MFDEITRITKLEDEFRKYQRDMEKKLDKMLKKYAVACGLFAGLSVFVGLAIVILITQVIP